MSLFTLAQLYKNIEKLASTMGDKPAEASMLTLFNTNLAEAKRAYPDQAILSAISQAEGEISIADLLIRTGQLQAVLQEIDHEHRMRAITNQPRQPRRRTGA